MSGDKKVARSANNVKCWDCAGHATERLEDMFVDIVQRRRIESGQRPARRTVFLKQHGAAYGTFAPLPDLPEDMRVGVFAMGPKPCWVRFSSDTQPTSPDLGTTLGIGIKLFDAPGPKLIGDSDTADFIMQNHDVFFVDNAAQMCEFTTAGVVDGNYPAYLREHPRTAKILDEMKKREASCLTADYWAILPFAFGVDANGKPRYVKYKLEPEGQPAGQPFNNNDYLALDLQRRLGRHEARFKFMVQFCTHPKTMPLDKATVRWDSPFVQIATLVLPQQDIHKRGQSEYGENLSFNIWRTPPEQEPQGSIAAARRVVYQGSADQRREANGVTLTEPKQPPPAGDDTPPPAPDNCIVKAAIYPPIGVARVGNSKSGFFVGPEVPCPSPEKPGFYRDKHGALKRQAARFRVYGLNAAGEAIAELTADNAEIEWKVHLANQKSSWYEFQIALDIPEATAAPPSLLRNSTIGDRKQLTIDPGGRKIGGKDEVGKRYRFDSGCFMGAEVYLGELRTDEAGRLIVLGGHGKSASCDGSRAVTFANNDGWYDDTSDGPVTAKVVYRGVELKVEPAWVVVAPPNYAPMLKSVRTMWDLMRDVAVGNGMLPCPPRPSFENDIRPIFERMTQLQWVNAGFAAAFGWGGPFDLTTPEWLSKLADPSPAYMEMRRTIANNFRHYDVDAWSPTPWPWLYGDAMSVPAAHTPRQHCTLTDLQLSFLEQWANGDFDADYLPDPSPPRAIDEVPVAAQPDTLTRAAMQFCLADAFHPGCEMTWPMRQPGMYMSAYRLKHAPKGWVPPAYGAELTAVVWSELPNGPIRGGQMPGTVTRWMAVPWQTDTASCRSGYDAAYDPYLPTFWPARVPNEVMSEKDYRTVMDTGLELSDRLQAFASRAQWVRPLGMDKGYTHQINHMIHHFDKMGVVEVREGIPGSKDFPPVMQVSEGKHDWAGQEHEKCLALTAVAPEAQERDQYDDADQDLTRIEKVRRFPHGLRN